MMMKMMGRIQNKIDRLRDATREDDDEKNCLKQQQSITITITITINQKGEFKFVVKEYYIKYLDVRVRGHSRFLRRRGDFVDLHFNNASPFYLVLKKEEEKGKRREREKKRLKKV